MSDLLMIHLQWFAADDEGRTEDPTDEKRRKAREEGRVARSKDFAESLVVLVGLAFLIFFPHLWGKDLIEMMKTYFSQLSSVEKGGWALDQSMQPWAYGLTSLIKTLGVFLALVFFMAFLANVVQVGFTLTMKPLAPRMDRISFSLGKWMTRSFFSGESLYTLFKSLIKVAIVTAISVLVLTNNISSLATLSQRTLGVALGFISLVLVELVFFNGLFLLAAGLLDWVMQRRFFLETIKMSKEEVKEERKQLEGDPIVRSRLKERMRQILSQNIYKAVSEADVLITNPTHYAVALAWDAEKMLAPEVLAKGEDDIALRMIQIARQHEVAIVENKPLARTLYASVDIGDMIPSDYWDIVSKILAEVYLLSGRFKVEDLRAEGKR